MTYHRIKAHAIRPGMRVARARTHPFVLIREARIGPKAVSLYSDQYAGVYARPQHHQLWWQEVDD